jgi:hypothetical protein
MVYYGGKIDTFSQHEVIKRNNLSYIIPEISFSLFETLDKLLIWKSWFWGERERFDM